MIRDHVYRIENWQNYYENSKSRERDRCSWASVPNKQDGLGYRCLLAMDNGEALYGAFVAMILVCSKHKSPRQGWLTYDGAPDGQPYDALDLAVKTGFTERTVRAMLEAVSSERIGWVVKVPVKSVQVPARAAKVPENELERGGAPEVPHGGLKVPPDCPPTAPGVPPEGREGREGRKEGEGARARARGMDAPPVSPDGDQIVRLSGFDRLIAFPAFQSLTRDQYQAVIVKQSPFMDFEDAAGEAIRRYQVKSKRPADIAEFIDAQYAYYERDHKDMTRQRAKEHKAREATIKDMAADIWVLESSGKDTDLDRLARLEQVWLQTHGKEALAQAKRQARGLADAEDAEQEKQEGAA
jgi:hypothetical protein